MTAYADIATLAASVAGAPTPILLGLDIDGVLAPIVGNAQHARLVDGAADAVCELAELTPVAVISGRSVADIGARFDFGDHVVVVGSHGGERRGEPTLVLDRAEIRRLDILGILADAAAVQAGPGAWVERKPTSVVLHVREAEPALGEEALTWLGEAAAGVEGYHAKPGHAVLELAARRASKADAIELLRERFNAATVVFVGDDVTDEEVFASMESGDFSIRVGEGLTVARHRLADPTSVLAWLHLLRDLLRDRG